MINNITAYVKFAFVCGWMLFLLPGCVAVPADSMLSEQLIAQPPSGWIEVYHLNQEENRMSEFIPASEDRYKWTHKISFESFIDLQSADPIKLLLYETELYKDRCNFVQHFNLYSGFENGYPVSVRLIMCGKSLQLETGEVTMLKAIQGEQSFYVIRLTRKVDPFEPHKSEVAKEDIAKWSTYMKRIFLCNSQTQEHPCPVNETE